MNANDMRWENRTYTYDPVLVKNDRLLNALILATQESSATIFHVGSHCFYPQGFSAFVILGESHTAVHSFPEEGQVWVEIVSCSLETDFSTFFKFFLGYIDAQETM